jgi:hypothetical protein
MKKRFFLLILPLFIFPALAGAVEFTLKEVRYDKKKIYLYPNEGQTNTLECGAGTPFVLEEAQDGFNEMYSMALSALVSGKKMQCWLSKCTTSAWGSTRPQAYACGLLAK